MTKTNCGVYTIWCAATDTWYVGQSANIRSRWTSHKGLLRKGKHHNKHLQAAWKKYGESAFEFGTMFYCIIAELTTLEQRYTTQLREHGMNVYNFGECTDNAWRGVKRGPQSLEHKAKHRRSGAAHQFFGKAHSIEHCNNISKSLTGKPTGRIGEKSSKVLLKEVQVVEILEKYMNGRSQRTLGKEYNIDWTAIGHIVRGKNWKHVPRPIGPRFYSTKRKTALERKTQC